ncbi:MAG: AraC family transcriptional regulator [Kordiimonadaceae bacterium]|nr:AraC family transcriptional regulator [Kordiimonadaceae bacterium]
MEIVPSPQANHLAFEATNPLEIQNTISRYFKSHDMKVLDKSSPLQTRLSRTHVGSTAFNILEYGGHVVINPKELGSFYLIHINLEGQCELTSDGTRISLNKHQAAICTTHRPHEFKWRPDSKVLAIQIPKTKMLAQARRLTCGTVSDDIDFELALDLDSPNSTALMDLIQFMLADTNSKHGLSQHQTTAHPLEQALITALLKIQPGTHQEAIALQENTAVPAHVRRAEVYMMNNLAHSIRMAELADIAGVTERTLTNGFQQFKGAPPARYFLCLRLAKAREQLQADTLGATVADIAFDLGFHHMSGFAAAYRQRYDELPSQTLKRNTSAPA